MGTSSKFYRFVFCLLSILMVMTFQIDHTSLATTSDFLIALGGGLGLFICLFVVEQSLKRTTLRAFNIALIGLSLGYLMGRSILLITDSVISVTAPVSPAQIHLIRGIVYLLSSYISLTLTAKAADEFHLVIPFVKMTGSKSKEPLILLDHTVLSDSRILDLATTGILDRVAMIPRFLVKELSQELLSEDEIVRSKAKRCLEAIKKLEALPQLELRYHEAEMAESKDVINKLLRLAKMCQARILTADPNRLKLSASDGVPVINIHALSTALKPIMQSGEFIAIKIQRYGKEPHQGVGYLEDGTMVVVNGGGDYIGDTVRCQVLSVKHTSSGRMIFCNVIDDIAVRRGDESAHSYHHASM
ncbi:MAG: conserved putative rane protein [Chlamydiales bacterium]|jgi:uncharacterized protein YacL|nr:conserved putative rane protein [Chlamydiales bacterium]